MTKYSIENKLEAIHAYLDGVETFKDIAQKYNVDKTLLKDWVARYREHVIPSRIKSTWHYTKYVS